MFAVIVSIVSIGTIHTDANVQTFAVFADCSQTAVRERWTFN